MSCVVCVCVFVRGMCSVVCVCVCVCARACVCVCVLAGKRALARGVCFICKVSLDSGEEFHMSHYTKT